ncbi:WXG100 family type VII secretion target [Nocardia sp. CDC159]|uniref:ESAT-6-like protein n=1 Tax=Nocardia pulmonis TaxID=2951408 RepID=A0A9X2IW19_9NOCA|nr:MULTISPECIES: WXG100 family type VII secretion target [Nocardia]MCM6774487.1 WXG100 family type VII secretion target [Nocardia pulmonis]MCM6787447.1 WXG100 family type VII secretion target [Nocardia sp. CDC159]
MADDYSYRVNLRQLDDAIATMATFGAEVDGWLGEVDRHVADLHLSWSSQAAEAQRLAHARWMAGAAEMRENLEELREVARRAHTNYSGVAQTNEGMWPQ